MVEGNQSNDQVKYPKVNLTVCVCTFNRADYLTDMLSGLVSQKWSEGDEILVINNNSTDHTSEIIANYKFSLPITEVFETKQGLSNARNRGLAESVGDVVVFLDDDLLITDSVIAAYRDAVAANPRHGFFGGKIRVSWPGGKVPSWWSDQDFGLLDGLLGNYNLGEDSFRYTKDSRLPYGANFALTRSTIDLVGEFDPELGMAGTAMGRGEETDFFIRSMEQGVSGLYVANAEVAHRVEPQRMGLKYLVYYGVGKGKIVPSQNIFSAFYRASIQAAKGCMQFVRRRRGYAMQCAIMVGVHLGAALKRD